MRQHRERLRPWLLLVVLLVEAALVLTGRIEVGTAAIVTGALEGIIFFFVLGELLLAVRRYRRARDEGLDVWRAVEDGIAVLMPRQAARFVAMEPRIGLALFRWVLRRHPSGPDDFTYARGSLLGPLLIVLIVTGPAEILLFEVVIPWAWPRMVLLVAVVYSVLWVVGLFASLRTLPHRLESDALGLRYGVLADECIPYEAIADVEHTRPLPAGVDEGLRVDRATNAASFLVSGRTDVMLRLAQPVALRGTSVDTIRLAVDDPEQLVVRLRERLAT